MARVTVEDCLPLVDNRFALVLLGTKRARQLMAGARPLIEAKDKPPVLALREVATGKVRFDRPVRAALAGQYDNEKLPQRASVSRRRRRLRDPGTRPPSPSACSSAPGPCTPALPARAGPRELSAR